MTNRIKVTSGTAKNILNGIGVATEEPCPFGCLFYCPCPDGCNGCELPSSEYKLLGDCRMPESKDCALRRRA